MERSPAKSARRTAPALSAAVLACALAAAAALGGEAAPAPARGVRDLAASHLRGQTFVTWTELAGRDDAEYAVYRSRRSFDRRAPEPGERIVTLRAGSAELREARAGEDCGHGLERKAIADRSRGGRPLPRGTGLFVHSAAEDGRFHYCVLASVRGRATESLGAAGVNATEFAVSESPAAPGAVELAATGPAGWYYLMHGDSREWSRDGADDLWGGSAWSFHAAVPEAVRPDEKLPVRVVLHGFGAQGARYPAAPAGLRLVYISAQDWQEGFWWGWARSLRPAGPEAWPPARGEAPAAGAAAAGPVEPCAARRLGRVVAWAAAGPDNLPAATDPARVYLYGHSIGGTGALDFILSAQPGAEKVAGAVATMFPVSWPADSPWERSLERVWGARRLGLPADGLAPERPAFETVTPLSLARRAAGRPLPFEPPLLELSLGTADRYAPAGDLRALCAALEEARVPFFAHWGAYGHENARLSGARNRAFDVRLDEPLLALARAACNDRPGTDPAGYVNAALEWSARANDFDPASRADDFLDAENGCAVSLRLVRGTPAEHRPDQADARATVDVTPRRLQRFRPRPGASYEWRALAADPAAPARTVELASGTVAADARGLVTVPGVPVLKRGLGTRLVIRAPEPEPQPPPPPPPPPPKPATKRDSVDEILDAGQ